MSRMSAFFHATGKRPTLHDSLMMLRRALCSVVPRLIIMEYVSLSSSCAVSLFFFFFFYILHSSSMENGVSTSSHCEMPSVMHSILCGRSSEASFVCQLKSCGFTFLLQSCHLYSQPPLVDSCEMEVGVVFALWLH